jgi:single-strand DNA-binding protein
MYQKLVIIGNLGKDPDMRYLPDGRPVTRLNVATNNTYKDANGQQVKETTWFQVSVFGKQAEACAQYLQKGKSVLVEGRLRPDKTTGGPRLYDKQDGSKGASFEVTALTVRFLGGGQRGEGGGAPAVADEDLAAMPDTAGDEEIPF